ncbi:MAG: Hpt domain-containing protein, partial [Serpentinimonas sp.]|nr:Hpt domain-containing protein [Serpentinimonas sp.]
MNAPTGSAPLALAPVPMSDSGPLSWVFEELRQCLEAADATLQRFVSDNAAARGGDLAEVDSSELRLLGQQLHQAVGALELVELSAAARTLRALELAVRQLTQKPALASADAAAAVSAGCRVLLDYLWRVLRQRPVAPEALFPTYSAWQQLAGVARIHPADLWDCELRTVPVPHTAPAPLTPAPALRTRIERGVLAVVKNRDPAAAAALVPLAAGLARGAGSPEAEQYWLAVAACFEALSEAGLPDSVYLKRAVAGVLSHYKAMESGCVEQWARPTHELLYLIACVPPDRQRTDWVYISAFWRVYGWPLPAAGAPSEPEPLGQGDALRLQQALAALHSAQQAWERWSAGDGSAPAGLALQRLGTCLDALSPFSSASAASVGAPEAVDAPPAAPAARSWSRTCSELAEQLSRDPATWPAGLALEVCTSLLCLGAELDDFDATDGAWRTRQQDLMERLHGCALGLPQAHTPLWMVERYRGFSERQSQAALLLQMRGDLIEVERALEAWLSNQQSASMAMPDGVWSRIDALQKVAEWLDLEPVVATLGAMRRRLWALDTKAEPPTPELESTQWLAHNFSALGLMLEALAQQPGRSGAAAFAFDPSTERLQALIPTASAATALPQVLAEMPPSSADQPLVPQPLEVPAAPARPELGSDEDDLLGVFVAEAQALCKQIEHGVALLQTQPSRAPELLAVRRAFHTLKGSARMVGQTEVGQFAWGMEQVLNVQLADRLPASPDLLRQCGAALQQIRAALGLESALAVDESAPALPAEPQIEAALPPRLPPRPEHVPVLREALTMPPVLDQPVKLVGPLRIELDLFNVFLTEADNWSQRLMQGLAALRPTASGVDAEPSQWELLSQQAHALAGGAATVGHEGLAQLARAIEQALERLAARPYAGKIHAAEPTHPVREAHARLTDAAQQVQRILHQFAAGILRDPSADMLLGLANVAPPAGAAYSVPPESEPASALRRLSAAPAAFALDPDLYAVFEDEAQLLLPQLHSALRQWSARPQHGTARSELLRLLHTFKGSARLAGALQLGERLHRLESQLLVLPELPQPEALRALQPEFDQIGADLTQLRRSSVKVGAVPAQRPSGHKPTGFWSEAAQASAAGHTLRMRADWLDRLVLHAADLSRSRTRLESDLLSVRHSFQDMASNVARLRSQLRELELQTETPLSPTGLPGTPTATGFDALELDRYTRPQELTRLMAEAVNDVVTVQHQLQRAMQSAEGNLAAQTRQTRELQRDLLRSRLLAFDALAERLQRSVRLAAEDCDKSVELHVQQGELELERGMLERLAPVLEHLLRNAVVHGLETDVQRHQLGKALPGRIVIALQAHDNDLSIT